MSIFGKPVSPHMRCIIVLVTIVVFLVSRDHGHCKNICKIKTKKERANGELIQDHEK